MRPIKVIKQKFIIRGLSVRTGEYILCQSNGIFNIIWLIKFDRVIDGVVHSSRGCGKSISDGNDYQIHDYNPGGIIHINSIVDVKKISRKEGEKYL
jgi:hypothetical protein